jgi:DNA-binding SARP family transcriptional activator/tetratricopeptide (TPR) repeat protein
MWFGVLGPLLVRDGDAVIGISAGRQRVLLAALLMQADAVVSADALAEFLWDGAPPFGAETTLRSHVMRLRRVLGPAAGARVVTRYPGYQIEATEEEVDLLRFRCLCRNGRAAVRAGEWARAWEMLSEALGLWRGRPLADIPSDLLRREHLPGLEQLRLQAAELRVDAGLQQGFHAELVPELESLAAQHPMQERFHAQLMLALVRCGRQAEALEAFQSAREVLVEKLGAEPGTELRELHRRVLNGDPALAAPGSAAPAGDRRAAVVPRELPAPVAGFVGRAAELAALTELLDRSGDQVPGVTVISAIDGTAGVGKTALAVHWAHQVAGRFPDGQLYVNLRGYDPDRPMPAGDALAGFLRALGVPGQEIPPEEDERAARYRSLLSGKRMLVLLDNAGSVEQVRPLLPGSSACAMVITSRDSLAGLVARDGARRLDLDVLSLDEAVGLLRELIGTRVDDDPGAAETLAVQCCRLPLALRVAAELAAARPTTPLAELTGELADQHRRLDLLDAGGDPRTAVRAVFSWSYRQLDAGAARAFRLLGLHPGSDFEAYAAAALTGTSLEDASRTLDVLSRAHLLQRSGSIRYRMHDLLRAYARLLARADDGEDEQRAALTRLFDHYVHTASVATDIVYTAERSRVTPPAAPGPPLTDSVAARAWLDAERANLVATTVRTCEQSWPGHAARLAVTLYRYLDSGGYYPEAIIIQGHGLRAARRTGDADAEVATLNALGIAHLRQGRCQQAAEFFQQTLTRSREAGSRLREGRALGNLGIASFMEGSYRQATGYYQQALTLCHETGDPLSEAIVLHNLSEIDWRQGRYHQAAKRCRQAVVLEREAGDRDNEAHALVNLGIVDLRLGRYRPAADHLQRALALFREHGDRDGEAGALTRLGAVESGLGRHDEAIGRHRQALALFREIGDQAGEATALNSLGETFLAAGQSVEVCTQHTFALGLASQTGDKYEQARAHYGLARGYQATGEPARAHRHWRPALMLFTELGAPEADQVRAQLAGKPAFTFLLAEAPDQLQLGEFLPGMTGRHLLQLRDSLALMNS